MSESHSLKQQERVNFIQDKIDKDELFRAYLAKCSKSKWEQLISPINVFNKRFAFSDDEKDH